MNMAFMSLNQIDVSYDKKKQILKGLNLNVEKGELVSLLGPSGCGKSTTGRVILRLIEPTSGSIIFDGTDVRGLSADGLRKMRTRMQIIFQDPFSSLNPRMTVSQAIEEPIRLHGIITDKREREHRVLELMETVGLAPRLYNTYPHELDGGRRQRIGIARALAVNPEFIVCDEPVSALDVSIQAQILNLMEDLQEQLAVMYLGRLLEKAPSDQLFQNPAHPYTEALLSAIPIPSLHNRRQRILMKGEITSPVNPPKACRFANRCPKATDRCFNEEPELREIGPGHMTACFLYE